MEDAKVWKSTWRDGDERDYMIGLRNTEGMWMQEMWEIKFRPNASTLMVGSG